MFITIRSCNIFFNLWSHKQSCPFWNNSSTQYNKKYNYDCCNFQKFHTEFNIGPFDFGTNSWLSWRVVEDVPFFADFFRPVNFKLDERRKNQKFAIRTYISAEEYKGSVSSGYPELKRWRAAIFLCFFRAHTWNKSTCSTAQIVSED